MGITMRQVEEVEQQHPLVKSNHIEHLMFDISLDVLALLTVHFAVLLTNTFLFCLISNKKQTQYFTLE